MSSVKKKSIRVNNRIAANGYRLCDPLPVNEILTDCTKHSWILGSVLGSGGFGEIYLCHKYDPNKSNTTKRSRDTESYVMKLDNSDGPLFAEMNFYFRVAKSEAINEWKLKHKMTFIGMPQYVASGMHETFTNGVNKKSKSLNGKSNYRFLVIPRFGNDLQKMLFNGKKLSPKIVADVTTQMIDVLQYIHSFGYIHADLKAANILQSLHDPNHWYLLDYGLAEKYLINTDSVHREEIPDKKRANNGTVEFRSRDAHIGLISRRSDIECLGYNVLLWLSGTLPWIKQITNALSVQQSKEHFMQNIDDSIKKCFGNKSPPSGVKEFFKEISKIPYSKEPNYKNLKKVIAKIRTNVDDSDTEDDDNDDNDRTLSPPKRIKGNSSSISKGTSKGTSKGASKDVSKGITKGKSSPKKYVRKVKNTVVTSPKSLNSTITISSDGGGDDYDKDGDGNGCNVFKPTPQMLEIQKLMEKKKSEASVKRKYKRK